MKRKALTTEQLVQIWQAVMREGVKQIDVAHTLRLKNGVISQAILRLRKYMRGEYGKKRFHTYIEAVRKIKSEDITNNHPSEDKPLVNQVEHDPYQDLEIALTNLQTAIEFLVISEVNRRVKEEKELAQKVIEEAKNNNFGTMLKRKLMGDL